MTTPAAREPLAWRIPTCNVGGIEALIEEPNGKVIPVIEDTSGHVHGTIRLGLHFIAGDDQVDCHHQTYSGYGPLPGSAQQPLEFSGSLASSLGFQGRCLDPTGLYVMGARHYDPVSGTFLSPDPLGHGATLDLYSYANGDPINFLDPTGRYGDGVTSSAKNDFNPNRKKRDHIPTEWQDIVAHSTGMARSRPKTVNPLTGEIGGIEDLLTGSPFQVNNLSTMLYQSIGLAFTLEGGVSPLVVAPAPAVSADLTIYFGFFGKDGLDIVTTQGYNLLFPGEGGEQHLGAYAGVGFDGIMISNARSIEEFETITNIRAANIELPLEMPPNLSIEYGSSDDGSIESFTGTFLIPNGEGFGMNYNAFKSEPIE